MVRRGFTLIELVVVVAVLGLLMAVITPFLRASRQKAKAVVCASNIRQLVIAVTAYSSNNGTAPHGFADSKIEPPGGFPGGLGYGKAGWWWFNYVGRFYDKKTDQEGLLCCPAKNLRDPKLKTNILCGNYGINQSISKSTSGDSSTEFVGRPLKIMDEIPKPSETLLVVDAGYELVNWWHATTDPPVPLDSAFIENTSYVPGMKINCRKAIWPGQEHDAVGGRHPNRAVNIGFADGHVESREADELLVEKREQRHDNRVPLWSPK